MPVSTKFTNFIFLATLIPASVTASTCEEPAVQSVCECGHHSWSNGYQCDKCKDKKKWGYGCDLECSKDKCPFGCDFSGNCNVPAECKRNSRVVNPTEADVVTNEHGYCQACESGFHGLFCTKRCPKNCADSSEGKCSRGGLCYKCKKGFYGGRLCDQECPAACPECVLNDNTVKAPDGESFLPAGACPEQCTTDHYGSTCSDPCPQNCKKTQGLLSSPRIPSCLKESGNCVKCTDSKWWGGKCEQACSTGCEGQRCDKDTGRCLAGCKAGLWGPNCDKQCSDGCNDKACGWNGICESGCVAGFFGELCDKACPEGTTSEGCDHESGEPKNCNSGSFPFLVARESRWTCKQCPDNCINHQCDNNGMCTEGCEVGFYNDDCTLNCPPRCEGACDKTATGLLWDGYCTACEEGWTGKKCTKRCHATCKACSQRGDAVGKEDCTKCNLDEPVELKDGHCACIEGATRNKDTNKCVCDDPDDAESMKMGRFELKPSKVCRFICKEGLREVFGNKESICLTNDAFKSVIRAEVAGFTQGGCKDNEYEIQIGKTEAKKCIRHDFVEDIIQA